MHDVGLYFPSSSFYSTLCLIAAVDFSTAADSLSFTSGVSNLPCQIPLMDDLIIEDDETFQLSLSLANTAQGSLSTTVANPSVATATIIDDGKCNSECGVSIEPLLSCTIELHYTL